MSHLLSVLLIWAAAALDRPVPALPRLELVSPAHIEGSWRRCTGVPWHGELAWYGCYAGPRAVHIIDPGPRPDLRWLSRLVHELGHHVLYEDGERALAVHQRLAYGIQLRFVAGQGVRDPLGFIGVTAEELDRTSRMPGRLAEMPGEGG